jgi:hypothetical protein
MWRRFATLWEKTSDARFPEDGGDLGDRPSSGTALLAFTFPCGGGFASRSRTRASAPALETEIGWPGRVAPGDLGTSATGHGPNIRSSREKTLRDVGSAAKCQRSA